MKKIIMALLLGLSLTLVTACGGGDNKNPQADMKNKAEAAVSQSLGNADAAATLPKVVDYSAEWCPPCRQLKPIFAEMKKEFAGRVDLVAVDVDENQEEARKLGIQSIPTLIFYNAEGKEVDRIVGLPDEDELQKRIEALIEK